jgi:hypothetical protein
MFSSLSGKQFDHDARLNEITAPCGDLGVARADFNPIAIKSLEFADDLGRFAGAGFPRTLPQPKDDVREALFSPVCKGQQSRRLETLT